MHLTLHRILFLALTAALFGVGVATTTAIAAEPKSPTTQQLVEEDWLFQCGGEPTYARVVREIAWTRDLAERISQMDGANKEKIAKLAASLAGLERLALHKHARRNIPDPKTLYLKVRRIKRLIAFANPLLNFNEILLIDNPYPNGPEGDTTNEWQHEARHRNGFMAVPGGRLIVVGLDGEVKRDLFAGKTGSFWRPDVHFSGEKIVVSFQPEKEKSFHLYELDKNGKNVKQLTYGDYSDLDPIYSPDGKILFCTERGNTYIRCMPMTHGYQLARCDADGKNIYLVSRNGEADYLPTLLSDGRVLYTRWEYTEKALWRVQSLWTMNPDGTNVQIFWGNQSVWPDMLIEARAIPNSRRVMFVGAGHHGWFDGSLGIIDPDKGLDHPNGLTKVTPEIPWPEVGDGPGCEYETDKYPERARKYHNNSGFLAYKTPYPLSEEDFLCSARQEEIGGTRENSQGQPCFNLYLMDVYGNRELIYKGKYNAYHAMPLCKRKAPPQLPDRVQWPKIGTNEKPANGILYSNDVFANAPKELRGKGKYIRVVQMDPKTYTTWYKTAMNDGPAVSIFQADGVKRVLGTVPIEKDGSVAMELPPGQALFFQMLDEKGQAIHVMRSFTGVMPGEVRGCFGCHESKLETRGNLPLPNQSIAMKKGARRPEEPSWGYNASVSYARFVQPVLDKNCGKCHQKEGTDAFKKLNMVSRPAAFQWLRNPNTRPGESSPFTEPYLTLVGGWEYWGKELEKDERGVPKNLAGVFIVEGYSVYSPVNMKTLPPYSAFSPTSTLIRNASSGKHGKGVKVSPEELERLVAWVDLNGPYLGDEEIRQMYDPYSWTVETIPSVRPRVATAPRINRFDIRQDGDSQKVAGVPLKIVKDAPRLRGLAQQGSWQLRREVATGAVKELQIKKATYGAGEKRVDVTKQVAAYAKKSRHINLPVGSDLADDPAPGVEKTLVIEYVLNGKSGRAEFGESEEVVLPWR